MSENDFLKFIISVRGGHFDDCPSAPEDLAAALCGCISDSYY